ncbi:MAG: hypothetical protein PUK66_07210 [Bacteroidales bacterium]|uniref:hypothetical protein n=1 Tax=Porphyromonas sp. TaxID=1924944 RepID=UPI0029795E1A|nr:hypothetical protein [Porphyromonas sp.]MDD7438600.1 hypothetical protein [Bacteroidales bacterium]MDY3067856.1 hypothetical protein [Porphyromonas sp.]
MKESRVSGGGVSFMGLLALTFIVLKLTKVIAWSWWIVLSPIWAPILFVMGVWVAYIFALIIKAIKR